MGHDSRVTQFAPVVPGYRIRFPQDEASHPDFRTEWWYITGWLKPSSSQAAGGAGAIGFQLTFFRTRAEIDERNPSAFTPRQIMIAHAALSDRARGRLVSDEKVARSAFGLAGAEEARTQVWIDDWMLAQEGLSYVTHIPAREFAMALRFTQTQPPILQGEDGFSRKGPSPESASYYYSVPHLRVEGTLVRAGRRSSVSGTAWLDHEWSSSYMDERAAGWDWVGINFDDGGALMAFRMRDRAGRKFWAGGAYRSADGTRRTFSEGEVEFVPLRAWRSPRTGTSYPVAWRVEVPAMTLTIEPLMDDQEHDTRVSVGTVYWEGAVVAHRNGKPAGRGYLELTGYWRPFRV
ncbi:MAG: lipocalin-like domain-containing protein [Burkholderiales bacterium]